MAIRAATGTPPHVRRGLCLVLAAPSGGGKTTIAQRLLELEPGLRQSVSATTRPPRPGEVDGVHYFFRSQAEFDGLAASGGMLEHAAVFGRSYGIPRAPVEAALAGGTDLLFAIDWQGHRTLLAKLPGDVVGVFLLPPSAAELERRLRSRGDAWEDVRHRMSLAASEESHAGEFAHAVVNDDLAAATGAVRALLMRARQERAGRR
jgi:guanylate kinase